MPEFQEIDPDASYPMMAAPTGEAISTVHRAIWEGRLRAEPHRARHLAAPEDTAAWRDTFVPASGPIDPDRL